MKRFVCIGLVFSILFFAGCGDRNQGGETRVTESGDSVFGETLPLDDLMIYESTGESSSEDSVEKENRTLSVLKVGRYSGLFVEDGSDEEAENVACLLVHNTTDQYLDYGEIRATIGETECCFVVTGLPGGAVVWVMEKDRCAMELDDGYQYIGETLSPLKDLSTEDSRVQVEFLKGKIAVTNLSDKDLSSVRVYYKRLHSDGYLLGGITYTTAIEGLKAGERAELTAGHSTETNCRVVRLDVTE